MPAGVGAGAPARVGAGTPAFVAAGTPASVGAGTPAGPGSTRPADAEPKQAGTAPTPGSRAGAGRGGGGGGVALPPGLAGASPQVVQQQAAAVAQALPAPDLVQVAGPAPAPVRR